MLKPSGRPPHLVELDLDLVTSVKTDLFSFFRKRRIGGVCNHTTFCQEAFAGRFEFISNQNHLINDAEKNIYLRILLYCIKLNSFHTNPSLNTVKFLLYLHNLMLTFSKLAFKLSRQATKSCTHHCFSHNYSRYKKNLLPINYSELYPH